MAHVSLPIKQGDNFEATLSPVVTDESIFFTIGGNDEHISPHLQSGSHSRQVKVGRVLWEQKDWKIVRAMHN